jgi:hypothetical protein
MIIRFVGIPFQNLRQKKGGGKGEWFWLSENAKDNKTNLLPPFPFTATLKFLAQLPQWLMISAQVKEDNDN